MADSGDSVLSKLVSSRTRANRVGEESADKPPVEPDATTSAAGSEDQKAKVSPAEVAAAADDDAEPVEPHAGWDEVGAPWGRRHLSVDGVEIDVLEMAEDDWADPPHAPLDLSFDLRDVSSGQWALSISWPAPDDGDVSVYRVIAGDGERPNTDCDDLDATVGVVTEPQLLDGTTNAVPLAAARYYEVWRYRGASIADAVVRPPYRYAEGFFVWPPINVSANVDHGQAVIAWDLIDDAGLTHRWLRLARREAQNPAHRPGPADAAESPPGGFVDRDAEPGQKYVYLIFSGVEVDGDVIWADQPHRVRLKIPEVLLPVTDLEIEHDLERDDVVHLSWTPVPSGKVVIYRSATAPREDIHEAGELDVAALASEEYGLAEEDAIARHPVRRDDEGRMWMRDVSVPRGHAEVHFTPVTQAGPKGVPGRSVGWLRLSPPAGAFLEDRVDWVLIVFEWPSGAEQVNLYATTASGPLDPAAVNPIEIIREDDHLRFGGFRVPRAKFAPGDCRIHLAAQRNYAGESVFSPTCMIEQTFPALVYYALDIRRGRAGKAKVLLTVWGPTPHEGVVMALAWRSGSLPLAQRDTELPKPLCMTPPLRIGPDRMTMELTLTAPLPTAGYLRMLTRPGDQIALMDPPLDTLHLG